MTRKLFVVSKDRPEVFQSLRRAIAGEPGVEVIYDRRLPGKAASREQVDRRVAPDLNGQLRERGFAVVHLAAATVRSNQMRRFNF